MPLYPEHLVSSQTKTVHSIHLELMLVTILHSYRVTIKQNSVYVKHSTFS
ncbi:hypothetical protein EPHNCH_0852 [Anaplasma phagocytophilum str. NCH-1]|uniref:Uncharacterized protein n=1 Tax=Anaplasma phagocytophilum str. NCH-1 TaxID=1359161 RepID=A0A0F3NC26_ANAPH|nr:hypothetical protein EPHNCH_0852 [Anaplasma phagocytophilum str. NCH-1]